MHTVKSILTRRYEVQLYREWEDNLIFYTVATGRPSQTPLVLFRTLVYEDASELFDDTTENLGKSLKENL